MLNYKLNNQQRLEQSYIYIANTILNLSCKNNSKVICVTSSLDEKLDKYLITKNIFNKMKENNKKVLFLNADNNISNCNESSDLNMKNCSKKEFIKILNDNKEDYDLILLNVPPIRLFAEGVEFARLCDETILIERYLYTKYKDYEDSILKLNQNNVKICGIITYR